MLPRICALLLLALAASSAVAFANGDVEHLIRQGDQFDAALDTQKALQSYLEAERLGGPTPDLLVKIARQYAFSMNDVASKDEQLKLGEKALEYSKRAVAMDPRSAKAHLAAAICYGRLASLVGNRTKVEYSRLIREHVEKSLQFDPTDSYAHHVYGAWHYELAGISPVLRTLAKMVYGEIPAASYEAAEKHFRKAVELAPERVSHHVELGRTYAALGKKDLARAELQKALELPSREKDDPESKRRAQEALRRL